MLVFCGSFRFIEENTEVYRTEMSQCDTSASISPPSHRNVGTRSTKLKNTPTDVTVPQTRKVDIQVCTLGSYYYFGTWAFAAAGRQGGGL